MESISKKNMENLLHQRAFSETLRAKNRRRSLKNMEDRLSVPALVVIQLASSNSAWLLSSHSESFATVFVALSASELFAARVVSMGNKRMKNKRRNEIELFFMITCRSSALTHDLS